MTFLKKLISKFDIYSIGVQLNFKSQEKQKSFFGGVVSLITFALIGFTIWFYGKETIMRQSPIIIESLREVIEAERIFVDKDNIVLMVGVQNSFSKSFVDNSVFQMKASIQQLNITVDPLTGAPSRMLVTHSRKISICDETDFDKDSLKPYFSKVNYKLYYCLKNSKEELNFIEGGFDQSKFSQMYIYVSKCQNSTQPNSVVCKSQEEIDKIMSSTKISFYLSDQLVNPLSFDQPFLDKGINQYSIISSKFQKEIQLFYSNSYIETDYGYFSKDIVKTRGFSFSSLTEVQISDDPSIICRVLLRMQKQKESFMQRRYQRIVDIAAQIGGLMKIITLIGSLFTKHFQRFQYHQRVVNEIFSFTTEEKVIENANIEQNNTRSKQQSCDLRFNPKDKSILQHDQIEKSFYRRGGNYLKQVMRVFRVTKEAMKYKFTDYIYHYIYPKKQEIKYKKPLLDYSKRKLLENLDILYILNKLIEIDKLKYILFDEDQLKLFEFIPKPQITLQDTKSTQKIVFQESAQTNSIQLQSPPLQRQNTKLPKFYFEADKTLSQKADDGKQSLMLILNKTNKSIIDQKLLNSIDSSLMEPNSQIELKGMHNSLCSPVVASGIEKIFNFQNTRNSEQTNILDEVCQKRNMSIEKSQFFEMQTKDKDKLSDQIIEINIPNRVKQKIINIYPITEQNTINEVNVSMQNQSNIEDLQSETSDIINHVKSQSIFFEKQQDLRDIETDEGKEIKQFSSLQQDEPS